GEKNMGNTCGEPLSFAEVAPEVAATASTLALTLFIAGEPFLRLNYRYNLLVVLVFESIRRVGSLFERWYEREGRCKYDLATLVEVMKTSMSVLYILEYAFVMFIILRLVNHARFWLRDTRTWVQYVLPTAFSVCPLVVVAQETFSGKTEPILRALQVHSIFIMQALSLVGVIVLWRRLVAFRHLLLIIAVLLIIELPASAEPIYETYFEPSQTLEDIKRFYAEYANIIFAVVTFAILLRQRIVVYRSRVCWEDDK
ncbi:hypothetical protein PENTCL1PPCAC_3426, partial [Pristionchus entomophagus]